MDSANLTCITFLGVILLIGFLIILNSNDKRKRIKKAAENYQKSLEALNRSPMDSKLRQQTLALGREYARVARKQKKETLFDEVALMNDLNAVGVATTTIDTSGENRVNKDNGKNIEQRLNALEDLKGKGLISADEYAERRAGILNEL